MFKPNSCQETGLNLNPSKWLQKQPESVSVYASDSHGVRRPIKTFIIMLMWMILEGFMTPSNWPFGWFQILGNGIRRSSDAIKINIVESLYLYRDCFMYLQLREMLQLRLFLYRES